MEAISKRLVELDELIQKLSHELHAARAVKGELQRILAEMEEGNEKESKDEKDN